MFEKYLSQMSYETFDKNSISYFFLCYNLFLRTPADSQTSFSHLRPETFKNKRIVVRLYFTQLIH